MIAVVILLRLFSQNVVVIETSYRMLEVFSFHHHQNEGLTSFHKNNRVNFSGKKGELKLSEVSIFQECAKKTLSQNLVLVVVLFLAGHEEDVA